MTVPTFSDGPSVPLMVEGVIDGITLSQLFTDLATSATVIGLREKGDPTAYAKPAELTPEVALERLQSGTARAVQIRYHFADYEWTDTIIAVPAGFRIVRCRHDLEP